MATSTNIWLDQSYGMRPANPDVHYAGNAVTRVSGEWVHILDFDVSGITDVNLVESATIWLRSDFFEDLTGSATRAPIGDSDFYGKLCPVIQSWNPETVSYAGRDYPTTGWGDGTEWINYAWDGSSPDLGASIADLWAPLDRGITLPVGPEDLNTGNDDHSLRYHMKADITALVRGWVDGSIPNYGLSVVVAPWVDPVEGCIRGTNQANIKGVAGAPAPADWGGNAVIEIIPEPATMSLLALGGLAALIRRKR
jgi:hypothetical protein